MTINVIHKIMRLVITLPFLPGEWPHKIGYILCTRIITIHFDALQAVYTSHRPIFLGSKDIIATAI